MSGQGQVTPGSAEGTEQLEGCGQTPPCPGQCGSGLGAHLGSPVGAGEALLATGAGKRQKEQLNPILPENT